MASTIPQLLTVLASIALPVLGLAQFPDCEIGPLSKNLVCNPDAPPADRAAALVAAMTLSEKEANLVKCAPSDLFPGSPRQVSCAARPVC